MEYWSDGVLILVQYSSQVYLKFFLTMLDTGFLILDFLYGIENQVSSIQNLQDKFSDFSIEVSNTPLFHFYHFAIKQFVE